MLALLGDSHVRSYILPELIVTRIFLGPGKENNFKNYFNFLDTLIRYLRATKRLKKDGLDFSFVIGEPDLRWLCYGAMNIEKSESVFLSTERLHPDDERIDKFLFKVRLFLKIVASFKSSPLVIIGSGTPNPEMIEASLNLNCRLSELCEELGYAFFDPQRDILSPHGFVREEFVACSFFNPNQKDWIHLSSSISQPFEKFIYDNKLNNNLGAGWKEELEFNKFFFEIKSFGTYRQKFFFLQKVMNLLRKVLRVS